VKSGREDHPDNQRKVGADVAKRTCKLIAVEPYRVAHVYIVRLQSNHTK
jgi:hypothetical protein